MEAYEKPRHFCYPPGRRRGEFVRVARNDLLLNALKSSIPAARPCYQGDAAFSCLACRRVLRKATASHTAAVIADGGPSGATPMMQSVSTALLSSGITVCLLRCSIAAPAAQHSKKYVPVAHARRFLKLIVSLLLRRVDERPVCRCLGQICHNIY
jgi:hypothetical protein